MVKGFNEAWRNSGRKESEISIRYQYKSKRAIEMKEWHFTARMIWITSVPQKISKKTKKGLDYSNDL